MKNKVFITAFSLVEISMVFLVLGILISGISTGLDLYQDFRITTAKSLTQNSRVGRIDGLVLWLESSQKSSYEPNNIKDGTPITKWKNIIPNQLTSEKSKYDAVKTSISVSGPIYRENIANSLPGLEFTNTENRCMQVASGFDGDGKYSSVFLVIRTADNWTNNIYYRMLSRWPASGAFYEIRNSDTPFSNSTSWESFYYIPSTNLPIKNKLYNFNLIIDRSSNLKFYINKKSLGAIANSWTGTYSASNLYIGCKAGNVSLFPDAYYLEIIVYDRAINDSERIDIENYLTQKWGNF
jgi:hypothetical protein